MKKKVIIFFIIIICIGLSFLFKTYFFHPNFYPIKSGVCAWAGNTRIYSSNESLSVYELHKLERILKPGDIIINRNHYYLSNYGIPGYWTHVSLYLGDIKTRKKFFDERFVDLLSERMNSKDAVIESISEGVILSSIEDAFRKDGLIVLRPKLSTEEVEKVILRSLKNLNKPYDFHFDFSTNDAIACTELIHLAFNDEVIVPVNSLFGLPFTTAQDMVESFQSGHSRIKLDLVYVYYDGVSAEAKKNSRAYQLLQTSLNEPGLW